MNQENFAENVRTITRVFQCQIFHIEVINVLLTEPQPTDTESQTGFREDLEMFVTYVQLQLLTLYVLLCSNLGFSMELNVLEHVSQTDFLCAVKFESLFIITVIIIINYLFTMWTAEKFRIAPKLNTSSIGFSLIES